MGFRAGEVRVRVPATSANLGPGFDCLGLALGLYDEVQAHVAADGVVVSVTGEGEGELPADETHLVASSALAAFEAMGVRPPGLRISCHNSIPQARGLGSSSAAIVAGITLARALVDDGVLDRASALGNSALGDLALGDFALALAAAIEGHPDNVAPCLLGGFTIAWTGASGARAVRLEPAAGVRPVIFVPDRRGLTAHARAALPATVPHRDAASNAARAALLVHALTAAPELLLEATEDRLHQGYRAAGMPETAALVARLRDADVPAVVSGAGPSVLALLSDAAQAQVPDVPGWRTLSPGCDMTGATGAVD